ncbi:MAG TPA: alpha/beta hydrolase [Xanthobacteraceae bacterium]|jgi:lysophospholipase|nr:alpha/beta hydrolase [Xanthobacteraceae bacterium]
MDLISIPANPVPEGAITGTLKTPDGVALRFARWRPPPGRKGTICLFHGRTEFIEKYFEVVRDAQARGFAVATIDWRGQGLSDRALDDPRKGHVRDFSEYDTDLETFMKEIVMPDCPPPYYGLAHSMGATVLIRAGHHGKRWFDRVVLSAPMIDLDGRPGSNAARRTAKMLRMLGFGTSYIPGGGATAVTSQPFLGNPVTSDPVRYERAAAIVEAEPKLGLGAPTIGWLAAAFRTMDELATPTYAWRIRLPMLMVAAGQDEIVSVPAIGDFATRTRSSSHVVIPGCRHEPMMEQDRYRSQFWAAFDAYVPGTPLFG